MALDREVHLGESPLDMWFDFGCPWSRIALVEIGRLLPEYSDKVSLRLRSLRLDASAPADYGRTTIENLCDHLDISADEARQMLSVVIQAGEEAQLRFNFDSARGANTFDAHRLSKWASTQGGHFELVTDIFDAHFEHGLLISDHKVLIELAVRNGFPRAKALEVLTDRCYADEVNQDELEANRLGIRQRPTFTNRDEVIAVGCSTHDEARNLLQEATAPAKRNGPNPSGFGPSFTSG